MWSDVLLLTHNCHSFNLQACFCTLLFRFQGCELWCMLFQTFPSLLTFILINHHIHILYHKMIFLLLLGRSHHHIYMLLYWFQDCKLWCLFYQLSPPDASIFVTYIIFSPWPHMLGYLFGGGALHLNHGWEQREMWWLIQPWTMLEMFFLFQVKFTFAQVLFPF